MTRSTQTNFRAEDFMVSSKNDQDDGTKPKSEPPTPKGPEQAPDGTTAEVLDWVGDDKARAQLALDKENAGDKPRKTLVEPLESMLEEPAEEPDAEGDGEQ